MARSKLPDATVDGLEPTSIIIITSSQHFHYNYLPKDIIRIISILLELLSSDEVGMKSLSFMEILFL